MHFMVDFMGTKYCGTSKLRPSIYQSCSLATPTRMFTNAAGGAGANMFGSNWRPALG